MSSEISTERVQLATPSSQNTLQPWQFFVLAALGCATAALFLVRLQGLAAVVLQSILIGTATLVGLAGLRMMRPLFSSNERSVTRISQQAREALEREKTLALRTIKELEFDRAMGKMSQSDFDEMSSRVRARAARLMRQLDASDGYRQRIEQDLAKRLATTDAPDGGDSPRSWTVVVRVCGKCSTQNENDARFCKGCGTRL